jgi:hypothetical protein
VELLSPCPFGPGAAGGFDGDGGDEPVVTPGAVLLDAVVFVSRIENNIPNPTKAAIAAPTPTVPQRRRSEARIVGGFIDPRVASSFWIEPPGLNSVAMVLLSLVLEGQRKPDLDVPQKEKSPRFRKGVQVECRVRLPRGDRRILRRAAPSAAWLSPDASRCECTSAKRRRA